jgi:hypothetical protein
MKQVAVLFDALRNEQFAVAVKSDDEISYYGPDGQGREWADWANSNKSKSLNTASLPTGVVLGSFKNSTDDQVKSLISGLGYDGVTSHASRLVQSVSFRFSSSVKTANKSKVPAIVDTPLTHFTTGQYSQVVNYKALALRTNIKEASALFEVRSNGYAYNHEKGYFNAKPGSPEEKTLRQRFDTSLSRSLERRIGMKVLESLEGPTVRTKVGISGNLETKSLEQDIKSIGRRIGGGTRGARRAGRMASQAFNPKAIDADGDGIVQDGSAFERPALPKVPGVVTRMGASVGDGFDPKAPGNATGTRKRKPGERVTLKPRSSTRLGDEFTGSPGTGTRQVKPGKKLGNVGQRQRMASARTERVSGGMASRAEKARKKSKARAVPGKDKVAETDGLAWQSMTPEQKKTVQENLVQRHEDLQEGIKKNFSGWWDGFVRENSNRKDSEGKNYNQYSPISEEALGDFYTEINDIITDELAKTPKDGASTEEIDKFNKRQETQVASLRRLLDDMTTLDTMSKNKDYSLLEHLHPASRQAAIGRVTAKGTKDNYKKVETTGNPALKILNSNESSSIFGKSGGRAKDKPLIGTKRDTKLAGLVRRLSEPNAERARKRQQRKNRASGTARRATEAKPVEKAKARIRRAKRAVQAKIRGDESPADVLKRSKKTIAEATHPMGITDSSDRDPMKAKYKVTDVFIERMAEVANEVGTLETGEKKKSRKSFDTNLLNLWENMEFNALPTAVSQDVFERLIGAGWKPHNRGVGSDPGFAEAYISEPDRFIPGQGMRVHGVGEYWAPPGSGHAWGYGSSQVIGFINPDARVVEKSDLLNAIGKGKQIRDIIKAYDAGFAKGEAMKTDPADYIENLFADIFKNIPEDSDIWDSPMGQIYKQMLDGYKDSGKDDKKRKYTWAALQHINSMYDDRDWLYFSPILGYDAVLDQGAVSLVHNRGAMVVLDRGTTVEEGKKIVGNGYALRTPKAA